jgi:IS30 family transposase
MVRTAQISKEERQSIITLRHVDLSIRNISRTFNVSSSAVAKIIKHYDETGSNEDRHRKGRPRVTAAAEDKFMRASGIAAQINASQISITDTSQHQLFRGDRVNQAFMVELMQKSHY